MKKSLLLLASIASFSFNSVAQNSGYDIKINFKGCKDTMVYLVKYTFDTQYIADTCKKIKNGQIQFKGNKELDKGVYTLVSEGKSIYFDLFINENQKFTINTDANDVVASLKATGNKENEQFFNYIKFITQKNVDFGKLAAQTKGKSTADSTKFMNEKVKTFNEEVKKFEIDFMAKAKGTYLYDVLNLKTEKEPTDIPKAKNGRPDSIYTYYYYKNHFFDGIDFKDERIIRTPFFDDRVKRYFDNVILMHPDTVIKEIDKVLGKCEPENLVYNMLIGYFTYKYEQSKIMGFDKVFVHVADKYIVSGRASKVYTEETVSKIKERVDIMRNLLLDSKVPELYCIDTTYGGMVRKMGFDTATSSKSITDIYLKNVERLTPLYKTLYSVQAKYTVLVFWAEDCGHCQTEVPKLHDALKDIKGSIDFKVFAVQTKDELYNGWKKFIKEKKLTDFIHVFDPIHINNLKEKFDIYSTPVIYILDKDKRIKAKRLGSEQVVDMLKTLESIEKASKQNKN
jgi:thiol-disulfide isomerase/thioredoxin